MHPLTSAGLTHSTSNTGQTEVLNKHSFNLVAKGLFNQTLLCKWIRVYVNERGSKIDVPFFKFGPAGR